MKMQLSMLIRFLRKQKIAYLIVDWNSKVPRHSRRASMRTARRCDGAYLLSGRSGRHGPTILGSQVQILLGKVETVRRWLDAREECL